MTDTMHGWYSAKMADSIRLSLPGSRGREPSIYSTPDGSSVSVTSVTKSPDDHGTEWDDMTYVGPVCKWIGHGTANHMNDDAYISEADQIADLEIEVRRLKDEVIADLKAEVERLRDVIEGQRVDLGLLKGAVRAGDPNDELRVRVEDMERRLSTPTGDGQ